jgi:hypothetical protein
MEAVDKEDEVGALFWNSLSRYLKSWAVGQGARDEHFHQKHLQGITAAAREIARTIAGMHAGFLTSPSTSFRPAAASVEDLQRWSEAPLLNVEAALPALRERHAASPDSGLGVLIQKLERLSLHFAPPESGHEETDLERVARVLREHGRGLMKTQIHGDLNTAQGLIAVGPGGGTLDRFFDAVEEGNAGKIQEAASELASRVRWIDFEGVPAKTLVDSSEDGRNSPFLDLGGIAQGCWYIANLCCYSQLGLNTQDHPENRVTARRVSLVLAGEMTPEEAAVPGLTAALSDLINGWFAAVTSAFLSGYLDEIEARKLGVNLLTPWDRNEAKAFMYFWILARAAHELRYETYGRDWGWEAIPGGRILQILRLQDLASAL